MFYHFATLLRALWKVSASKESIIGGSYHAACAMNHLDKNCAEEVRVSIEAYLVKNDERDAKHAEVTAENSFIKKTFPKSFQRSGKIFVLTMCNRNYQV